VHERRCFWPTHLLLCSVPRSSNASNAKRGSSFLQRAPLILFIGAITAQGASRQSRRERKRRPVSTLRRAATSPKPLPRSPKTPPLIDISDSEDSAKSPEAQSFPATTPTSRLAIQTPLDSRHSAFDEYMLQSHPECFHRTRPLPVHWQSWSWSQLKEPHFPKSHTYDEHDDLDDDEDRYASLADERAQAAHTLSMLSRSR